VEKEQAFLDVCNGCGRDECEKNKRLDEFCDALHEMVSQEEAWRSALIAWSLGIKHIKDHFGGIV
jgi:hypothetical protein